MLTPSRTRYRKPHRGNTRGMVTNGNSRVLYGSYGLMALEPSWITANQIESARIAINRVVKKYGRTWIRIFPDKPFTKKPAETRQGSGKGNVEGYVAVVRPGQIMFEVDIALGAETCRMALTRAGHKLPIKWRIEEKVNL
ncbi:MAG: 50S ribosomal protein L16 [bacterium]|nr:50S ribosomal protein L16 [bacterium]